MERMVGFQENEAPVNQRLLHAVLTRQAKLVAQLLHQGIDPNCREIQNNESERPKTAAAFLPTQARKERWLRINSPVDGYLLHRAVTDSSPEIVKMLLEHGAKVNVLDRLQTHALHFACMKAGSADVLSVLLQTTGCLVNLQDARGGKTSLMYAALIGESENVSQLLKSDADVNMLDEQGHNAIYMCCSKSPLGNLYNDKKADCLKFILKKEPKMSNSDFQKAFLVAVENSFIGVLDVLLNHGTQPTYESIKRCCMIKMNPIIAKHLLSHYKNSGGIARILKDLLVYTSSKWMVDHTSEETKIHNVAKVLIKYSPDLDGTIANIVDPCLITPRDNPFESPDACLMEHGWVYLAMVYGKLSVARLLRIAGCDIKKLQLLAWTSPNTSPDISMQLSLLRLLNEPLELKQVCRRVIRHHIKHNLQDRLETMSEYLSENLVMYLNMHDLEKVDAFDLCVRSSGEISMDETYFDRERSKAAMAQAMWVYPYLN